MGEVISLDEHRARRAATHGSRTHGWARHAGPRPVTTFSFDLVSPATYFAAERVEQLFPGVVWRPVIAPVELAEAQRPAIVQAAAVHVATARAAELGMPLVWPERFPASGRAAIRVAAWAAERGQAASFVLAASRLAFCGGFDLDDPEILAEAAAAAALPFEECLGVAGDRSRDAALEQAGRDLAAEGAEELPVLHVGSRAFCGEDRLAEASAAARGTWLGRSPAPLGSSAG